MKSRQQILSKQLQTIKNKFSSYTASIILLFATVSLSGCSNVNPSFGYAFGGTWVLLAIAFFIASSVTKNNDHHGHH